MNGARGWVLRLNDPAAVTRVAKKLGRAAPGDTVELDVPVDIRTRPMKRWEPAVIVSALDTPDRPAGIWAVGQLDGMLRPLFRQDPHLRRPLVAFNGTVTDLDPDDFADVLPATSPLLTEQRARSPHEIPVEHIVALHRHHRPGAGQLDVPATPRSIRWRTVQLTRPQRWSMSPHSTWTPEATRFRRWHVSVAGVICQSAATGNAGRFTCHMFGRSRPVTLPDAYAELTTLTGHRRPVLESVVAEVGRALDADGGVVAAVEFDGPADLLEQSRAAQVELSRAADAAFATQHTVADELAAAATPGTTRVGLFAGWWFDGDPLAWVLPDMVGDLRRCAPLDGGCIILAGDPELLERHGGVLLDTAADDGGLPNIPRAGTPIDHPLLVEAATRLAQ